MSSPLIQPLESRRLLAADLSVASKSTTLPDTFVVGLPTAGIAQVTLANLGDALVKADADVVLTATLVSGGQSFSLGSTKLKANAVKAAAKAVPIKLVVPPGLPAGTYQLTVTANGPADSNAANNTVPLKTVTAEAASADVAVTGTISLAGAVVSPATGKATVVIRNQGNITAKATGTIDILSTINGVTTTVGTLPNVLINLPKTKFFTSKPIAFTVTSSTSVSTTLTARFTPAAPLTNDLLANNTQPIGSLSIGQPPPSPLDGTNLTKTITFKSTRYQVFGGLGFETGTYTAPGGRAGSFYMTVGTGITNGATSFTPTAGTILPVLVLHPKSGAPKWGSKTITFGVDQSASSGYVEVAGKTIYYK